MPTDADRTNLKGIYAEWAEGRLAAGAEFFSDGISFEPKSDGRQVLRLEDIDAYLRDFLSQWSSFRAVAKDFTEVGETLIVHEIQYATGVGSGVEVEQAFYCGWTFRDGQVIRVRWDNTLAEARAAAG